MAQIRLNRMKSSCSSFMSSSAMTRPRGKFNMASGWIAELHTVLSVRDAARLFCVASEKLFVSRDSSCGRPLGWLMQSDTETTLESQKVNSFSLSFKSCCGNKNIGWRTARCSSIAVVAVKEETQKEDGVEGWGVNFVSASSAFPYNLRKRKLILALASVSQHNSQGSNH